MEKEVRIDSGLEEDQRTLLLKEIYDKINEYNEKNPDRELDVMVLAIDKEGGSSFFIGSIRKIVMELIEVSSRHPAFDGFIKYVKDL